MSSSGKALDAVLDFLVDLISPLRDPAQTGGVALFLAGRSWYVIDVDSAAVAEAAATVTDTIRQVDVKSASLADLVDSLERLAGAGQAIAGLTVKLADSIPGTSATGLSVLLGPLAADTLDGLVVELVQRRWPRAYRVLQIAGLIDDMTPAPLSSGGVSPLLARVAMPRRSLNFDALGPLLVDPGAHVRKRLGMGGAADQAEAERIIRSTFVPLARLAEECGANTAVGLNKTAEDDQERKAARSAAFIFGLPVNDLDPSLEAWFSVVAEIRPSSIGPAGLALEPSGGVAYTRALGPGSLRLEMAGDPGEVFFPALGGPPQVQRGEGQGVEFNLRFDLVPGRGSPVVIGATTAGLVIDGLHAGATARFGRPGAASLDVLLEFALDKTRFVFKPRPDDGFLAKVLPTEGLAVDFAVGIEWSNTRGLRFTGAAGLEADLPIHLDILGILKVDAMHVRVGADEGGLHAAIVADVVAKLGPISADVQGIGLGAAVTPVKQSPGTVSGGNLGPVSLAVRYLPPKGIGLSVKTEVITGGGGLEADVDKLQYAGVVQLAIKNSINLTTVALLNAKLPDNRPGFSLLLIVTVQFPPIQLGLGFTLNGVGGLAGVNRVAAVDQLRAGLRSGTLDTLLFPPNPLGDPPGLVRSISTIFPLAEGRYVFGPMVRIGWGAPTLLTLDLCVLLELPDPVRILILGRLALSLPDPKNPLVKLRMDALGVIDLGRSEFSLDATLYDSRILSFTLTGDMAMRLRWGKEPDFILSVGGFNPRYSPPAALPPLRRMALSLVDAKEIRVRFESYLAITSNTAQFGSRVEFFLQALGLEAAGFLGFDALFHFAPFELVADLAGAVAVSMNGQQLLAADVQLTLTGPTPWHLFGHARLMLLGVATEVPVELLIGDAAPPDLPPPIEVLPLVRGALADPRNWVPRLPTDAEAAAVFRPVEDPPPAPGDPLPPPLLHPLSAVEVRQTVAPLGRELQRFGSAPVQGPARLELAALPDASGRLPTSGELMEQFAMGQFRALTDDEKLSSPAFELAPAGLRLGGEDFVFAETGALSSGLRCEMLILEGTTAPATRDRKPIAPAAVTAMTAFAAAAERRSVGAARYGEVP